jgi:hypothetical protein
MALHQAQLGVHDMTSAEGNAGGQVEQYKERRGRLNVTNKG